MDNTDFDKRFDIARCDIIFWITDYVDLTRITMIVLLASWGLLLRTKL